MPRSVCACLLLSLPSRLLVKDVRWASGLAGLYYERIFPSVPALFSEENGVAEDVLRFTLLQVRKLRIAAKHPFPHESALFQHARRGAMLVVAERISSEMRSAFPRTPGARRALDPVGERFPFRIVLRRPMLAARMELGAAGFMRKRHRQQPALERHAGENHPRCGFEVLP